MKIAAYCRVSTDKDEQLDSLEHQKEFFSEYAEKNGHELVRLYADEGISGTSLKKRSEFQRLMKDANLGIFDMVVVKDISRFARNTVDFLQSIRTLKKYGVNTLFLTANMESLGESEFVLTVFGALAQEESINLSKRVKFGKKINAKKGRVPQRIFGYNRIDNFTLEINPQEAKVVREIYRLYLEGLGCRTISLELNRLGYKTKFNCEWDPRSIRRVLKNSIYCGIYVNNKYEVIDCLEGTRALIPEEQHFHHNRPEWAIITPEIFNKVQLQLEQRRSQYKSGEDFKQARYSSKHIFSTLIKCETCGRSFFQKHYNTTGKRGADKVRVYWKCHTNDQYTAKYCDNNITINESDLLDEIKNYFKSLIEDKDTFIKSILAEIEKKLPEEQNTFDTSAIERKRKLLIGKKDKYQEMYAADVMTMTELKEKTSAINEELKELDYSIKQYEQALAIQQNTTNFIEKYMQEIEYFLNLENVTNLDLKKIIDHISVSKDGNVKIYLKNLTN